MDSETNSPSYMSAVTDSSVNPAWNEILSAIPEEYHQALTPTLQNWDKGVNERFQKIHEDYAPWKALTEQGYSPTDAEFAFNLAKRVEQDPVEIYNTLQTYLDEQGLLEALGGQEENEDAAEYGDDPRIQQLLDGYNTLAEAQLMQLQQAQDAEEDAALEAEFDAMRAKYGDWDEDAEMFILNQMANAGMDTEEAVQSYFSFVDKIRTSNNRPAPRVVGSTGSFPVGQDRIDPKKFNETQRVDYVADLLRHLNDQV